MEALVTALLAFGPAGIASAVALYVFRHLYLRIEELQEKRLEEMKVNLAAQTANTAALMANTAALSGNTNVIQALVSSSDQTRQALQNLVLKGN